MSDESTGDTTDVDVEGTPRKDHSYPKSCFSQDIDPSLLSTKIEHISKEVSRALQLFRVHSLKFSR